MRIRTVFRKVAFTLVLTLGITQLVYGGQKKTASDKSLAVSVVLPGDIDQRIAAAELELTRLSASLEQLRQDSIRAAADAVNSKAAALAKAAPLESGYTQKSQELTAVKNQRDKARHDSLALASKRISRIAAQKQESARMDGAILAASNQLNALSARKQQIPADEPAGDGKAVSVIAHDITRADSAVAAKQAESAALGKKRDQLHQDSLSEEAKTAEARGRIQNESRRLDSLLQLSAGSQSDVAARQAKGRELTTAVGQEQARLSERERTKAVVDAQIARTKGEMAAIGAQRDRLRTAAGVAQKKMDVARSPLSDALAASEAKLGEITDQKEGCAGLGEKVRLDSAIQKAKDALNTAIEQNAVGKKGAEKAVQQREAEVAELMGKLDDVVRKNPKTAQVAGVLAGLSTTSEKRRRIDSLMGTFAAEILVRTARRDQAKRALEGFDRAHPVSGGSLTLYDSLFMVKQKSVSMLEARSDTVENQISQSEHALETLQAAAGAETSRTDSAASIVRKQRSDLAMQRAQVRADSLKTESGLMVALIRLRSEQSKIVGQRAALDRDMANLDAVKERFKLSIVEAQNRDKQTKAANQMERKRLDSLIGVKEREVSELSMQNEKQNQDSQAALKESDMLLQKQAALIGSLVSQIALAEQDVSSIALQVDSSRKLRASQEKAGQDKLREIGRDIASAIAAVTVKKVEIFNLKSQRETMRRGLASELAHLDSMVSAAGKVIASYEGLREKARQDSAGAEASQTDAQLKSVTALRSNDSVNVVKQQQVTDAAAILEKARQDSVAKSAQQSTAFDRALNTADSIVAVKERELADARRQREQARLNQVAEQRRKFALVVATHQEVINRRAQLDQKRADAALVQTQRKKIQQDSAVSVARYQMALRAAAADMARLMSALQQKKSELSALQTQRSDCAAKLTAMGATAPSVPVAPIPAASSPAVSASSASADAGQKQLEEIYLLIGSEKPDEAITRFNTQRAFLAKTVSAEAFSVINYTIEQLEQAKKNKGKKK